MREKSTEQKLVEEVYSGVVDGGDIDIKCHICDKTLAHIMVSNVNANMRNVFVLNCPFCKQEHIITTVEGTVHIDSASHVDFIDMQTQISEDNESHRLQNVMIIRTVYSKRERRCE